MAKKDKQNVVIKKHYHEHDHVSHGVWKLAYADFMTGLMAFFIFMWIINLVSADQSAGLSSYFAPEVISESKQGIGLPDNGQTPQDSQGGKISTQSVLAQQASIPRFGEDYDGDNQGMIRDNSIFTKTGKANAKPTPPDGKKLGDADKKLKQSLVDKFRDFQIQNSIIVEEVPEGVKIQLLDGLRNKMFTARNGSAITPFFERILDLIVDLTKETNFQMVIDGHSQSFYSARGLSFTAWELSLDRALSVYRYLQLSGLTEDRFVSINGNADNELLYTADQSHIANNRVTILLTKNGRFGNLAEENKAKGKPSPYSHELLGAIMAKLHNDIVIHKEVEEEEPFHGGNWKIVYADFVTAMMAFFLLMWILNALEKETLEGLSNYFEVTSVKEPKNSGSGNIFGGVTFNEEGRVQNSKHSTALDLEYSLKRFNEAPVKKKGLDTVSQLAAEKTVDTSARNQFKSTKDNIQTALKSLPKEMEIFASSVQIDVSNETIFIRILDKPEAKYFYPQSQILTKEAIEILQLISINLIRLDNKIYLMGYNDPTANNNIFRLDLSLKRANESRKEMERVGLDYYRFGRIYGLNSKSAAEDTNDLFTLRKDDDGKTIQEVLRIVLVNDQALNNKGGGQTVQTGPSIFVDRAKQEASDQAIDAAKQAVKTFSDKAVSGSGASPAPTIDKGAIVPAAPAAAQ